MKKNLLFLLTILITSGWRLHGAAPINPKFENFEYDFTEERPLEFIYFYPDHKGRYHDENGVEISKAEAERRNNNYRSFYGDYSIDWPTFVENDRARDNIMRVMRNRLYREENKHGYFMLADDGQSDLDEILLRRFRTSIDVGFPEDRLSMIVVTRRGDIVEMVVVPEVGVDASNVNLYPNKEHYKFNINTGELLSATSHETNSAGQTTTTAKETVINTPDNLSDAEIDKTIRRLWEGVPDHGQNNKTRMSFSKRFYDLITIAFAIPGDNPGGIGSEDVVWYWYTYQDTGLNPGISKININNISDDQISATVVYDDGMGTITPHNLVLIKEVRRSGTNTEETRWVINEFDNMKDTLYDYVNSVGVDYTHGLADRVIEENSDWMTPEDIDSYKKEVDIFLEKFNGIYPNGVVRR